jgi:hypothetical protein
MSSRTAYALHNEQAGELVAKGQRHEREDGQTTETN